MGLNYLRYREKDRWKKRRDLDYIREDSIV
jgi:hypothetical protein